jgi:hypothetical protein
MLKRTCATLIVIALLALPAAAATVKIKQNRTPLRSEATTTSAVVVYYQAGDVLDLIDVVNGWYKVRDLRTRQEGFILMTLAELLPGPAGGTPRDQPESPAPPRPTPPDSPQQASPTQPPPAQPGRGEPPRTAAPTPAASPAAQGKPSTKPVAAATQKKAVPASRWTDVGYIAVNGGYQGGAPGFSETFSFAQYVEQATISTDYPKKDGPAFDVGGAFRVWRNLAAGIAVSTVTRSTEGGVTGSIPNPFFFDAGRAVSGTASLKHTETALHLQAAYVIPAGRKLLVTVAGGPSFFSVKQSLVEKVQFSESYPYDTATLLPVTTTDATKSVVGFNGGLDIGYYFTRTVGVGGMLRYAGGTLSLPSHGTNLPVKVGGFQAGAGVRIRIPKPAPKKTLIKPAPPPPRPLKK